MRRFCLWGSHPGYMQIGSAEDKAYVREQRALLAWARGWARFVNELLLTARQQGEAFESISETLGKLGTPAGEAMRDIRQAIEVMDRLSTRRVQGSP